MAKAKHFMGKFKRAHKLRFAKPKIKRRELSQLELESRERSRIVRTLKKTQFRPYVEGLIKGKTIVQLRDMMVSLGVPHRIES